MSAQFRNSTSFAASASGSAAAASASAAASGSAAYSRQARSAYTRSASVAAPAYNSQIEQAVINARQPIQVNERAQIQAGQFRGTYLNKSEVDQFRGPIPVEQYKINDDSNPEVIRKRLDKVKYTQEVAVRYLNPPQPPKPGDLVIRERQGQIPAGPPVVIRQEACQPKTPLPVVYREAPPPRPPCVPPQTIEVEGEPIPPPARRVVVEKLSSLPQKPQNILIEKWLPYKPQKRRVVYQRSCAQAPPNPRNLVIEWESPDADVEQVCKDLGVVDADPEEYRRRYGPELKNSCEIPNLCQGPAPCQRREPTPAPLPAPTPCGCRAPTPAPLPAPTPCGCRAPTPAPLPAPTPAPACNSCGSSSASGALPELEGDVDALRRVNLEAHGLGAYRRYFQ